MKMREMRSRSAICLLMLLGAVLGSCNAVVVDRTATEPPRPADLHVLFLGDGGHHRPAQRAQQLIPAMLARGIYVHYTEDPHDLNPQTLARFGALMLYADIEQITPEQEQALIGFVEGGKGFVGLHSASHCFRNSPSFAALVGAQFKSHGMEKFRTRIAVPDHPVMKGFPGFESEDETYVHEHHDADSRTVLEYRDNEPYTWTRSQGHGRVFYTAWGHDQRTWGNPGFIDLVERGIRWAAGQDVQAVLASRKLLAPPRYVDQKVPYYPPNAKWGTADDSWTKMPEPLSPQESMRRMVTPAGFRVELFACEPQIGKPLCLAWDERGRLWIAETMDYPNDKRPEDQGRDRIVILEDSDSDGRADQFTVFAENLSIPTSIQFSNGGIIVQHAPDTLFLKDTDGDDKADVRQVLMSGWGIQDTHAGPSNLQYGLDNWIWGVVGYSGFEGHVGSQHHKFRMGFYRFRPDGSELEFIRKTNNNTWGLGFSEEGFVFGSTANNNPSVYVPLAQRYYQQVNGWEAGVLGGIADTARFLPITDRVRQVDVHGGYTAAAGHALYTARAYPREYWNRIAFVCEPTGHLIGQFVLQRRGADFKSHNPSNLLASDDEWTAPTMAEVGPDGNIWFIDWYNYIVQHNPTPPGYDTGRGGAYETPLRDKHRARIYRIVYDGAKPLGTLSLAGARPEQLVATLRDDNLFWRRHAQRLLVERGEKNVVPALIELVADQGVDGLQLNVGAIHALWSMHGLGVLDGSDPSALASVVAALRHPSPAVRRSAALVLPANGDSASALLAAGLLEDGDAQVRLAAVTKLAEVPPSAQLGSAIYAMLKRKENSSDRVLLDALGAAGAIHHAGFLAAKAADDANVTGSPAAAEHPLAQGPLRVVGVVERHAGSVASTGGELAPDGTLAIDVRTVPGLMRYDKTRLVVKSGQKVRLTFTNNDVMQHNLLLLKPGTVEQVGLLADEMITNPEGLKRQYVPDTPAVWAYTPLVDPETKAVLEFTAPSEPGAYPFICTFPGHWRIMQGQLVVEAESGTPSPPGGSPVEQAPSN